MLGGKVTIKRRQSAQPGSHRLADRASREVIGILSFALEITLYTILLTTKDVREDACRRPRGDRAKDALLERRQCGHQIGDFQALRRRLADMFIKVEQARSKVMRGLAAPVDRDTLRAIVAAAKTPVQLHGGIGVTKEHLVSHHFQRPVAFGLRHGGARSKRSRRRANLRCRLERTIPKINWGNFYELLVDMHILQAE